VCRKRDPHSLDPHSEIAFYLSLRTYTRMIPFHISFIPLFLSFFHFTIITLDSQTLISREKLYLTRPCLACGCYREINSWFLYSGHFAIFHGGYLPLLEFWNVSSYIWLIAGHRARITQNIQLLRSGNLYFQPILHDSLSVWSL